MDEFLKAVTTFINSVLNETQTEDDIDYEPEVVVKFQSLYRIDKSIDAILTLVGLLVVTFMTKRKARCRDCCGGYFGLAVPTNFLEERTRRNPYVAAFAMAAIAIIQSTWSMSDLTAGESSSVKIIVKLVMVCVLGCQFLPLFACIHMGTLPACVFGLIYHLVILVLNIIAAIPVPNVSTGGLVDELVLNCIVQATAGPFITYWFVKRIIRYYRNEVVERHIIPKSQAIYVRNLFLSKDKYLVLQELGSLNETEENKLVQMFKKHIYRNVPGFRYSLTILISCTVGFLMVTHIVINNYYDMILTVTATMDRLESYKYLKATSIPNFVSMLVKRFTRKETRDANPVNDADAISLYDVIYAQSMIILVATILGGVLAYVITIGSICHVMTCYRKNVLGLAKQKRNLMIISSENVSNISLVRSAIQYGGYQAAYLVAGFTLQVIVLTLTIFILGEIIILPIQFAFWSFVLKVLEILGPIILALIFIQLTQYLFVRFCFLEDRGETMALTNRRGFFIMSYFVFFYNIFGGIFSSIKRLLIGAAVGALLVPRLDTSVFPRIFEKYDSGFKAYSYLLHLEALQSNPIVVTFVIFLTQTSSKSQQKSANFIRQNLTILKLKLHRKRCVARNRWFVAYTLVRNPNIIIYRGHLTMLSVMEAYSKPIPKAIEGKNRNSIVPY